MSESYNWAVDAAEDKEDIQVVEIDRTRPLTGGELYSFFKQSLDFFDLRWNEQDKMNVVLLEGKIGFEYNGESVFINVVKGIK